MFPIDNIPAAIRWISYLVWGSYYIEIVRDAMLEGGGWPATWFSVAMIGFIGGVFYAIAWRTMRRMQLET
jgi:ABC-2 type transport system permease protein